MTTGRPNISVVIPLHNKQAHILATIQSVLAQSLQPLEIIVVDDGSTDQSAELIQTQLATNPDYQRVRLIQQANGGVAKARNVGIEAANNMPRHAGLAGWPARPGLPVRFFKKGHRSTIRLVGSGRPSAIEIG